MFVTKYKGKFVFATDSIQPGGHIRFKANNVVEIPVSVGENPPFVGFEPNETKPIKSNDKLTLVSELGFYEFTLAEKTNLFVMIENTGEKIVTLRTDGEKFKVSEKLAFAVTFKRYSTPGQEPFTESVTIILKGICSVTKVLAEGSDKVTFSLDPDYYTGSIKENGIIENDSIQAGGTQEVDLEISIIPDH